ncbi:hypothetical protein BC941DRAFT_344648 [Chlamydoabsidia padenii]|nr:hypothetical protein BC941DRAFT_344648 [Chlamydoabsidia padenii]
MTNLEDLFKDLGFGINGRTLVALKGFPAGTVLLEQSPLTQVPLPSIRRQRCNYCLRRAALQCCGRCRSAYFCSNTCFRNAWLHYHHVLCEPLEYDTYTNVDADRWLLERAALTLHSHARLNKHNSHSPPHLNVNNNHFLPATGWLPTTTPGAITTSRPAVPIDFDAVSEMLAPFDCPFRADELLTVQEQISLSRFDILDPEQHMDKVGYGVYPLTTLYVPHSCRPNTGVTYRQDKQRLVSLEAIAPGDTITISYVDLTLPRSARLDDLRLRFGPDHDCTCERCQGDFACLDQLLDHQKHLRLDQASTMLEQDIKSWSILETVKQSLEKGRTAQPLDADTRLVPSEFSHFVSQAVQGTSMETFSAFTKESRSVFTQSTIPVIQSLMTCHSVPAFSVNMIRAAEVSLRQLMDQQKWTEAAKCATYLFVVYRLMYPPLHPVCSFHTIILAKTCWNSLIQLELVGIGNKLESIYMDGIRTWIDVARDSVLTCFGEESGLWREIIDLQWVFERDQKLR